MNSHRASPATEVPTGGTVRGEVRPPSSKSVSHRVMNLTLLSGRASRVRHLLEAEDLDLFRAAFRACGWTLRGTSDDLELEPGNPPAGEVAIECGNAGTMFRFLVATLSAIPGVFRVDGTPRLRERPIQPLVDALGALGARIQYLDQIGHAPLRVWGGSLGGGECSLDASQSSQYLSALLMACSFAPRPSRIEVEALVSTPYVEVTLGAMRKAGLREPRRDRSSWWVEPGTVSPRSAGSRLEVSVDGDYSAAAYWAAAAMITGGKVSMTGLDPSSPQGDRGFLDLLVTAGGQLQWHQDRLEFSGKPCAALDVDMSSMPDQVPTLAAVAAFCPGITRIRNVEHLRIKESDRLHAVAQQWGVMGVEVDEQRDGLAIHGRPQWLDRVPALDHCDVETYDDHRIAMSAALVGLRRPLRILSPGVVSKSYPGFWDDLFRLVGD